MASDMDRQKSKIESIAKDYHGSSQADLHIENLCQQFEIDRRNAPGNKRCKCCRYTLPGMLLPGLHVSNFLPVSGCVIPLPAQPEPQKEPK